VESVCYKEAALAELPENQSSHNETFQTLANSPLNNTASRSSRGDEAQISAEKEAMREPPHVGRYFLNKPLKLANAEPDAGRSVSVTIASAGGPQPVHRETFANPIHYCVGVWVFTLEVNNSTCCSPAISASRSLVE
jgi:hypothetical protein